MNSTIVNLITNARLFIKVTFVNLEKIAIIKIE